MHKVCENMAYQSFRSEKCSARGVRKRKTGITGLWQPSVHRDVAFRGSNPRIAVGLNPNAPFESSKSWGRGRAFNTQVLIPVLILIDNINTYTLQVLHTANLRTKILASRGLDSSRLLIVQGWNCHVHRECSGSLESRSLRRDNLRREIGRTEAKTEMSTNANACTSICSSAPAKWVGSRQGVQEVS